ncbi:uncharacterized protein K452DRAFT_265265 [Aplosporella prunicola CBS 121167]|uniref:Transmembrane protein n=1 Tax=Aplosporella prunicola CBS 121167 TaxID=1176127 RepID=A0A6A6BL54_9PEZI|nr:uncharacterized protein K452DRAFT_265265 [Aplosporella prunicola CBS 121167]KAF2144852.1 hypothetical protein K452DRAFT_265265 [Aplosporella prunicola CBS 121167]
MESSPTDLKVSCIALGFTLGFGFLTTWDAWKITSVMRDPRRSLFVWMVWSELAVNLVMAVVIWLFIEGVLTNLLGTFIGILCLWVVQIQFILQIIINRIAIVTTDRNRLNMIRWITIGLITCVNISVFCIFIPGHLDIKPFVELNEVWDKITKVIIGLNDACLNYYFIMQVKKRLVANGLQKYNALVDFNTKIALISVAMDGLIIGTMFLKNGAVFIQFHPVAYTVKLKIELSMTNLIKRISQESVRDLHMGNSSSNTRSRGERRFAGVGDNHANSTHVMADHNDVDSHALEDMGQIVQKREYTVKVSSASTGSQNESMFSYQKQLDNDSDEVPLHHPDEIRRST